MYDNVVYEKMLNSCIFVCFFVVLGMEGVIFMVYNNFFRNNYDLLYYYI